MNDDLTPLAVPPMDEETRARIRARLTEATRAGDPEPGWRRWVLPVAAAAAVLVVAFGVGAVAWWPGGGAAAPAGRTTSSGAPTAEATTPSRTDTPGEPRLSASPEAVEHGTAAVPGTAPPPDQGACADAVDQQLRGPADRVVTWQLPDGAAGIWVAGGRAVLCEDSGGIPTAHRARPADAGPLEPDQLGWSTSVYGTDGKRLRTAFVAGGPLPQGVTGIEYAWPDGQVERARIVEGDGRRWWLVSHVPTAGVLVDRGTNFLHLDDVRVTVSLSGTQRTFDLPFATSMCAQVNHGC